MAVISETRTIKAPLEKVWAVAGDFTKCPIPAWPLEIAKPGDADNHRIGCERLVRDGKTVYHERLTAIDPPRSLTYEMFAGAPLKRYIGKVELSPAGEYTNVSWTVDIVSKIPCTAWIINRIARKNCNRFLDELEKIQ